MLLMSFSATGKLFGSPALKFRRHTNKNCPRLTAEGFRLRGFEFEKKENAELFDAACGEPEICDFYVKALQINGTRLTRISASVSTPCRGSGA